MSSTNNDLPPKRERRSSLKADNNGSKLGSILTRKNKRNSVSFGQSCTFQFKEMKATFKESKDLNTNEKEKAEKHKNFVENRRKSIQNEFSLVKELMKNKMIEEDDDDEEEERVKQNTCRNVKMGHEALNEVSESSSSSDNEEKSEDKSEEKSDEENDKKKD